MSRQRAGIGILEGLEDQSNEPQSTGTQPAEPQQEEEETYKRSYMLTEGQIDKVSLLKIKIKKNYSEIVGEAIEFFYKHITDNEN